MIKQPKILIGTLFSGENEFSECVKAVQVQTYTKWEHKIFKNLPNKEAHDKLYSFFMDNADKVDIFIKLDADMVFTDENSLAKIVKLFTDDKDLDYASMAVSDWFSGVLIMGVHAFRSNARWERHEEQLFVDHSPKIKGHRKIYWSYPAPLVSHSPNPSNFQAFHFGVHRALKVLQLNRRNIDLNRSKFQWRLLSDVWDNFARLRDKRLGLVLLGVEGVLSGEIEQEQYDYTNAQSLDKYFKVCNRMTVSGMEKKIQHKWKNKQYRRVRMYQKIGIKRLVIKVIVYVREYFLNKRRK